MVKKFFIMFVVCTPLLLIGCKTTEPADIGNIRESSTYILGQLESSIATFDGGVERALERSKSIADEVERLDYLFREYERAALQLRDDLRETKAKLEALSNIYDSSDSSCVVDDSRSGCNNTTKS